ncbi:DUF1292 domain-containing protein [Metabacillus litoralis]|uniref:DUF1292 domain-containing protein n=1 Tax=Metabacillus litoralis TaxID=152268 RepID=A0A5C6W380_9BACI|nr:DUF1292 domain-containing protein [Metabacillus litoralis]TXC90804.1 DUF1292 domain-containing protein [Metabacillus litoralis]
MNDQERDFIVVEDEQGHEKQYIVEALFDIEDETFALLQESEDHTNTIIMQVEDEQDGQYLVNIDDHKKKNMILDAYEIAVHANPAD